MGESKEERDGSINHGKVGLRIKMIVKICMMAAVVDKKQNLEVRALKCEPSA
jgi:hypothetical protein